MGGVQGCSCSNSNHQKCDKCGHCMENCPGSYCRSSSCGNCVAYRNRRDEEAERERRRRHREEEFERHRRRQEQEERDRERNQQTIRNATGRAPSRRITGSLADRAWSYFNSPDADIGTELNLKKCTNLGKRGNLSGSWTSLPDYLEYELRNQNNGKFHNVQIYMPDSSEDTLQVTVGDKRLEAHHLRRTLFFTQKSGQKETFFFAMYVYEFGNDSGIPRNDGRVYIAYLDSTPYYVKPPNEHNLASQIIGAYCDYVGALGFTRAHIWSCPPPGVEDFYIFNTGNRGKVRSRQQLADYYQKTLERTGLSFEYKSRVVIDENNLDVALFPGDIKKQCMEAGESEAIADIFVVDVTSSQWQGNFFEHFELLDTSVATKRSTLFHLDFKSAQTAASSTGSVLDCAKKAAAPKQLPQNGNKISNPTWPRFASVNGSEESRQQTVKHAFQIPDMQNLGGANILLEYANRVGQGQVPLNTGALTAMGLKPVPNRYAEARQDQSVGPNEDLWSLYGAASEGLLTIESCIAGGFGNRALTVTLQSCTDKQVNFVIEKGVVFEQGKMHSRNQNLAVFSEVRQKIDGGKREQFNIDARCMDRSKGSPSHDPMNITPFVTASASLGSQGDFWNERDSILSALGSVQG